MTQNQQEYPLHRTICTYDLNKFLDMLLNPNVDIYQRDDNGDTPLILCIQRYQTIEFIQVLAKKGCEIPAWDKSNRSPVYLSLMNSTINISKSFLCAMMHLLWTEIIILEQARKILICSYDFKDCERFNVYINDLNPFLDYFLSEEREDKKLCKNVINALIDQSLTTLSKATIFKIVWNKVSSSSIVKNCAASTIKSCFGYPCKIVDWEVIDCLHLILDTLNALNCYYMNTISFKSLHFHDKILDILTIRHVELNEKISMLVRSLKIAEVTIQEIRNVYRVYGFNEEVVFLIQNFMFSPVSILNNSIYNKVLHFIRELDTNPLLSLDNINHLGLIQKQTYCSLLNILPDSKVSETCYANIRAKKEVLNKVPTLYELSKFHSQKYIQYVYKIKTPKEFCRFVRRFALPNIIKNSLCENPPLCYELFSIPTKF